MAHGNDIAILQEEIAAWADDLIPDRTAYSTIAKLLEEIGELIASERMSDPEELADVAILVLDLFHLQGVDMAEAVRNKMSTNIRRKWKISDNGSASHIN
jgi:NTP pyrophosphatase (non-canonical NTP hydrolase)